MKPDLPTTAKGQRGEARALAFLRSHGYAVVETNFRCRGGELDIVARDQGTLVFVEVRTRADAARGDALATVGYRKQRQLERVARYYLALRRPEFQTCRFDVVGITAGELTLVKDAFRPGWP